MKQTNFFAYALIIIGMAFLLYEFNVIEFGRSELIIAVSFLLGLIWFRKAMLHADRKGLLGGTFWLLFGFMILLMRNFILPTTDTFAFGMVFLILAIANLVTFAATRQNASNISSALLFTALGTAFMAVYYNYISEWKLADLFSIYWPLLLVAGGVYLVIEGIRKRVR